MRWRQRRTIGLDIENNSEDWEEVVCLSQTLCGIIISPRERQGIDQLLLEAQEKKMRLSHLFEFVIRHYSSAGIAYFKSLLSEPDLNKYNLWWKGFCRPQTGN